MTSAKVPFQPQPHRTIGGEDHGHSLGRRLSTQDLDDGFIEDLDARVALPGKRIGDGHGWPRALWDSIHAFAPCELLSQTVLRIKDLRRSET
jgi:hypothetical protein